MKKLVIYFIFIIAIFFLSLTIVSVDFSGAKKATVYTNKTDYFIEQSKKKEFDDYTCFEVDVKNVDNVLSIINHCYAIEYTYANLDINELMKDYSARVVNITILDDCIIYELYSKKVQTLTNNYHKLYNMQICVSKNEAKVGIPLILGI